MLTLVLVTVFIVLIVWAFKKPSDLPPGRWGLPFIGYIPLYTKDISTILKDFRKEYGDIFTWKIGGRVFVGLSDYKLIKTVFNRPEFQGRPDIYTFKVATFFKNLGIINSDGDTWLYGRRFAIRHLRDFGMGKSSLENVILYEADALVKNFAQYHGKPIEISWTLNVAVLNVIWKLVANQRYEVDDQEIMKFNKMINGNVEIIQGSALAINLYPGVEKYIPTVIKDWMNLNKLQENIDEFASFFTEIIKEHRKKLDPNNPQDYIDAYLIETESGKEDNLGNIFEDNHLNLLTSILDLFAAGSETTSSTLRWFIAIMACYPDIQTKMQKEIDEVIPRHQRPSLQDRASLPYTDAVLHEVLRYSTLTPFGVFHATTEDATVGDYRIPKGTAVFASALSCHRDPEYFERPYDFYPEHFLDEDGKFNMKKEGFVPFSIGKRQCLGESLAKMELFLFSTCLFQKFTVMSHGEDAMKAIKAPSQPFLNLIQSYEVIFNCRD